MAGNKYLVKTVPINKFKESNLSFKVDQGLDECWYIKDATKYDFKEAKKRKI